METFKNQKDKHNHRVFLSLLFVFVIIFAISGVVFLYFYNASLKKNQSETKAPVKTEEEETTSGNNGESNVPKPDQKYLEPVTETPIPEGMKGPSPVPVIVVPKS